LFKKITRTATAPFIGFFLDSYLKYCPAAGCGNHLYTGVLGPSAISISCQTAIFYHLKPKVSDEGTPATHFEIRMYYHRFLQVTMTYYPFPKMLNRLSHTGNIQE
jgi:hypothetical protein